MTQDKTEGKKTWFEEYKKLESDIRGLQEQKKKLLDEREKLKEKISNNKT